MTMPAHIQVVEDTAIQARMLSRVLEGAGYSVDLAGNGVEALAAIERRRPDLVISDVMMPEMDGYQLTRELKQHPALRGIPVMLLTVLTEAEEILLGLECGADDYVVKPWDESRMLKKVAALLASGAAPEEATAVKLRFGPREYRITAPRSRILNLLLSTYENAIGINSRLLDSQLEIKDANQQLTSSLEVLARSEKNLRASEQRFRSIVQLVPDIVYRIDVDGCFVYLNDAVERLLGYKPEELIGQHFSTIMEPAEASAVSREQVLARNRGIKTGTTAAPSLFDERRTGARSTVGLEVMLRPKLARQREGEIIILHCEINASGFYDAEPSEPGHQFLGTVGVIRDITERKAVERTKDTLVSSVSHELRTPLTSLRGFVELLRHRDYPVERQRQFLEIIDKESQRLGRLLDEFLDIQRMESGRQPYDMQDLDLAPLLDHAIELFKVGNPRCRFRADLNDDLPRVRGDSERLIQVIENLLSNAVKFSPDDALITVSARQTDGYVQVAVSDQGIGIAEDQMPRLFDTFFRVDLPKDQRQPGTGLGLALVKSVVNAHGGEVEVESVPGKGSTFSFTLPKAAGMASPIGDAAEDDAEVTT